MTKEQVVDSDMLGFIAMVSAFITESYSPVIWVDSPLVATMMPGCSLSNLMKAIMGGS